MTVETGYNGWRNYQTWAINLWLSNVETYYRQARIAAADPEPVLAIRNLVDDIVAGSDQSGLTADLVRHVGLVDVDWDAIVAAFKEE